MNAPSTFDAAYFGEMLESIRLQKGLSIRQAAAEIGISAATISRLELGGKPDIDTFFAVCEWAKWKKQMSAFYPGKFLTNQS